MTKVKMDVDLGGVHMQNPICTASGTFGNGRQFESFFDLFERRVIHYRTLELPEQWHQSLIRITVIFLNRLTRSAAVSLFTSQMSHDGSPSLAQ